MGTTVNGNKVKLRAKILRLLNIMWLLWWFDPVPRNWHVSGPSVPSLLSVLHSIYSHWYGAITIKCDWSLYVCTLAHCRTLVWPFEQVDTSYVSFTDNPSMFDKSIRQTVSSEVHTGVNLEVYCSQDQWAIFIFMSDKKRHCQNTVIHKDLASTGKSPP